MSRRDKMRPGKRAPKRESGRQPTASSHTARTPSATADGRSPDWVVLALAVVGIGITGYLTGVAATGSGAAFCGEGSGCEIVQSSRWSTLLNLPIAAWGLALYTVIAVAAWTMPPRLKRWRRLSLLALTGVAISAYLTAAGLWYLDAACGWCLASFAVITAIFIATLLRRPEAAPGSDWKTWSANSAVTAAIVVTALHVWQLDLLRPESPGLKALAEHLDESDAHFYGAYWCPACQAQKRDFGASAERLPYVECTPDGRGGGLSEACAAQDITQYPTWIIDGRRFLGALAPEELARHSGFQWRDGG